MIEGIRLMAVGMTTVFAFLGLLVLAMHGSAAFFEANAHRFPEPEPPRPKRPPAADDTEIAVVLAAIAAHRSGRKG